MEKYLIERDTLGKIVDELIAKKFPNRPSSGLETFREDNIKKLDDQIGTAIFGQLSRAQLAKVNEMFDRDEDDPSAFEIFFKNAGIDLEQTVSDAVVKFSQEFLGDEDV